MGRTVKRITGFFKDFNLKKWWSIFGFSTFLIIFITVLGIDITAIFLFIFLYGLVIFIPTVLHLTFKLYIMVISRPLKGGMTPGRDLEIDLIDEKGRR